MKRRHAAILLSLALCFALIRPVKADEGQPAFFIAVNDSIFLPFSNSTMPVWSGGILYAPYAAFDATRSGTDFGINSAYSRDLSIVTVYNLREMLEFDINEGTCRNPATKETYAAKAIIHNGNAYLPVAMLCRHFGLTYSLSQTEYGSLLRIKNEKVVLDDVSFIDAAGPMLNSLLREYKQSLSPDQNPDQDPDTPNQEEKENPVMIAFTSVPSAFEAGVISALNTYHAHAVFFFTPEEIPLRDTFIRRLIQDGHKIGIDLSKAPREKLFSLAEQANEMLSRIAYQKTYIVRANTAHVQILKENGFLCYQAEKLISANGGSAETARRAIANLPTGRPMQYLTFANEQTVLSSLGSLLHLLDQQKFTITRPLESRI